MRRCWSAAALLLIAACGGAPGTEDCATSEPLAAGASTRVPVEVVTKEGLDVNMIGTLDVAGGLYTTSMGELGPETDLGVGRYDGVVTRDGDELMLVVEGRTMPLNAQSCD